jgi:hypothetical protein
MFQTSIIAGLLIFQVSQAQQSQNPLTQPQPTQNKPAPCVPRAADPSKQIRIKPNSRWQILLEKQRAKIEQATGITLPDQSLDDLARAAQAPAPCPAPSTTNPIPVTTPKQ